MRSSVLTKELMDLVDQFNGWEYEQRMVFLDLVDPQPEEPAPAKTTKKKRTRQTQTSKCAADCGYGKGHAIHSDSKLAGYHEFKFAGNSGKSARASQMAEAIKKRAPGEPQCVACYEVEAHEHHGDGPGQHKFETNVSARLQRLMNGDKCAYVADGKTCLGARDSAIHDATMGYAAYHEFAGPGAQAAAGGEG